MYRNQGLGLQPAILATCAAVFREAARTLYGGNKFLYLLRDGGGASSGSDGEQDHQWGASGPAARRATTRGGRRGAAPLPEKFDINLDRYIRYVRHIAIEAEHNRFDEAAQTRAVSAVRVFTDRYPPMVPADGGLCTRLAGLELRVVPMWEADVGGFTFLDWLGVDTALMRSIRDLSCDRLTVRVLPPPSAAHAGGRHRRLRDAEGGGGGGGGDDVDDGPPTFTRELCMYDHQVGRLVREFGVADVWPGDGATQLGREARLRRMEDGFATLQRVLEDVCRDASYGERGCPPVVEDGEEEDGDGDGEGQDAEEGDSDGEDWLADVDFDEELLLMDVDDTDDEDYQD